MILTSEETAQWEAFVSERDSHTSILSDIQNKLGKLLAVAFGRALQDGKWRIRIDGSWVYAEPADPDTERLLTRLCQDSVLVNWHDSLWIGDDQGGLIVRFNDGDVAVSLEFTHEDPDEVIAASKKLKLQIDLGDWVRVQRIEAAKELRQRIISMQQDLQRMEEKLFAMESP